ncbi:hypothetical protein BGZ49_000734 [Haplosporangium sp. Z 27]|nr:hypothetical protein BGZ49_000734 [Haplosporangium sp. Z 27]
MKVFTSLHSLTLRHPGLDDGDIATTLTAMTEARKFHVSSSNFLGNSYRALMANHAMTIQHLDFWNCTTITSTMVQGILTGCPSLESLQAKAILGTDLVRIVDDDPKDPTAPERLILGKDWVCLKLKRLVVHFDLSSARAHIDQSTPEGKTRFKRQQELEQYHAFRQVSRLTELEALDFRGDATISQGKKCLNLKLRSRGGELEQLASLKKLSHIEFYSTEQDMTEEEIDWMLEHWPKLTIFEGEPQKDRALCQKLINYANVGLTLRAKRRYEVFMSYCSWSNTANT